MSIRLTAAIVAAFALLVAPRVYADGTAVMSIVGSELTVVNARPSTGRIADPNVLESIDFTDPVLDRSAVDVAERALQSTFPGEAVVRLAAGDRA